jgi:nucleoside 2-deoxyribosyltransferase
MRKRIYLAGPEVFLSNAREIGARKRAICEQHRLLGVFPADEEDICDPARRVLTRGSRSAVRWNASCEPAMP